MLVMAKSMSVWFWEGKMKEVRAMMTRTGCLCVLDKEKEPTEGCVVGFA